jgi:ABC-type lipoprotein export system ATPase subunit
MERQPMITVHDLLKEFKLGGETIAAVNGVGFTVHRGEIVSIVGPSGSGKSTLLGLIGGLDSPTAGSVTLDGVEISGMNERALTNIRNEKLGFVFQFFNLIPTLSALENVALPIQFARKRRFKPEERATELLTHLGLGDRLNHRPQQLSGGEQQRVAIARAVVPVHMWGHPADMDRINATARAHGIKVVEDAAHAHGSLYKGLKAGVLGDVGCFSLQASKGMTAGEGGVLVTNERTFYERAMLLLQSPGRLQQELTDPQLRRFATTGVGPKYRISGMAAALAGVQLKKLDAWYGFLLVAPSVGYAFFSIKGRKTR